MGQGAPGSRRPVRRGVDDDERPGRLMGTPESAGATRQVVVGLGRVDPALVTGVLGDGIEFIPRPTDDDLAVAVGAIVRADRRSTDS